ncbi:threonine export protein RhtC [Salmonella enterica]|nr:threonine export protein RhtC [Salmonella enterica]
MLMLFFTVAMVHIVALMSPGPDFFFVSQTAVSRSRKEAMMGVLGITCGVMVWAGVALLGLYLCWMGYQMLRGALKKQDAAASSPHIELAQSGRSFLKGLLTNLSNPKAIIYFGSVFSLFVGDNVGAAARWGIFALITLETLAWFTVVASLFALPKMRRGYQRLAKWIDGFAGALFAGFGIHLIISR